MNFANLFRLLAAAEDNTPDIIDKAYGTYINIVHIVMPVIIAIVVSFGLVYGIILGVQFAKAEDTDARDKAKQRLINMVIGVVVAAVIVSVVYVILGSGWIKNLFANTYINPSIAGTTDHPEPSTSSAFLANF